MYELASLMFTQACKKGMCIFQKKTLIMRRGVRFKTHHDFISMSKYGLHSPDNRHMQSTTNPIAHTPSAQTLPTNRPTPPTLSVSFPLLLAVGSSGLYHDHPLYGSLLVSAVMRR